MQRRPVVSKVDDRCDESVVLLPELVVVPVPGGEDRGLRIEAVPQALPDGCATAVVQKLAEQVLASLFLDEAHSVSQCRPVQERIAHFATGVDDEVMEPSRVRAGLAPQRERSVDQFGRQDRCESPVVVHVRRPQRDRNGGAIFPLPTQQLVGGNRASRRPGTLCDQDRGR